MQQKIRFTLIKAGEKKEDVTPPKRSFFSNQEGEHHEPCLNESEQSNISPKSSTEETSQLEISVSITVAPAIVPLNT